MALDSVMDHRSTEKLSVEPPSYSFRPKVTEAGKKWILLAVVLLLLSIIIIGATLVGVYMSQKHTEQVMTMAFTSKDGEKIQQTVVVNEQQTMAAFSVKSDNGSATVLYDYTQRIIGFRAAKSEKCFVMKMDKTRTPSIKSVTEGIKYFQTHNSPADSEVSYSITELDQANATKLGTSMNLLCSDVPIYWAESKYSDARRWRIKAKFKVFGVPVEVKVNG